MTDLSWQWGLILVVLCATVLPWLFALIADKFGTEDDWDHVAETKRRTAKRARQLSREFK